MAERKDLVIDQQIKVDCPSNSFKSKEESVEVKVKKVVKNPVLKKKKSWFERFKEGFLGENVGSISSYVFHEVLIPAARNTVSDILHGSTDIILGDDRASRARRHDYGRGGYVSYNRYFDDRRGTPPTTSARNMARHNFDDIIIRTKIEADDVLDRLAEIISTYGEATVADLYDAVGIPSDHTHQKYGWVNISTARSVRVRDGFILDLPRTTLLD